MPDHDVAAEEVLQALGGEPCPCLRLREFLRRRGDFTLGLATPAVTPRQQWLGSTATGPAHRAAVYQSLVARQRALRPPQTTGAISVPSEVSSIFAAIDQVPPRPPAHLFRPPR